MKEIHGELSIESAPGSGTTVTATVPLPAPTKAPGSISA
jgi:signal transduction histidine kinase